jgi:hypothetical protein
MKNLCRRLLFNQSTLKRRDGPQNGLWPLGGEAEIRGRLDVAGALFCGRMAGAAAEGRRAPPQSSVSVSPIATVGLTPGWAIFGEAVPQDGPRPLCRLAPCRRKPTSRPLA